MVKNVTISVALISVFAMLLLSSGCGRFCAEDDFDKNPQKIRIYGETRYDLGFVLVEHEGFIEGLNAAKPYYIIDLPFSFVLDTILLPFDLIHRSHVLDNINVSI